MYLENSKWCRACSSRWQRLKMMTGLGNMGAFMPGGENMLKLIGKKGDTGHRKTAKERADERKKKKKKR